MKSQGAIGQILFCKLLLPTVNQNNRRSKLAVILTEHIFLHQQCRICYVYIATAVNHLCNFLFYCLLLHCVFFLTLHPLHANLSFILQCTTMLVFHQLLVFKSFVREGNILKWSSMMPYNILDSLLPHFTFECPQRKVLNWYLTFLYDVFGQ